MKSKFVPNEADEKHFSKGIQIEAWYTLMIGVEKVHGEVGDTLNKMWDGKKWQGTDTQFSELMTKMMIVVSAMKQITPPSFINKQHEQLIESNEYYLKFVIHAGMGKPSDAKEYFDKSQELRNSSIAAIQAVDNALE